MKVNFSTTNALNYSQTLYEWSLAGLITEGKITREWHGSEYKLIDVGETKYSIEFEFCSKNYQEALKHVGILATPGRKEWAQKEILSRCFEINQAILPICLAEGLLDLKDIAAGIGAGVSSIPTERDR